MPASVVAMVQARLEALDPALRRALRAASVFGESFTSDGVQALVRDAAIDAGAELERLVELEVMVRRGDFAFRHALVREAAYAMLTDADRRLGHRLAARWLEERGEPDALLLAEHYARADEHDDAARCFARAAQQALGRNDFEAALARGQRAIELGAAGLALADAHCARGKAFACLGHWAEADRALASAIALVPAELLERRAELLKEQWNVGLFRQDSALLEQTGRAALEIAQRLERPDLLTEANGALATAAHADGRCDEAISLLGRALSEWGDQPSLIIALSTIILYHAAEYEECERWTGRMLELAERVGDWHTAVVVQGNRALALAGQGRYVEAEEGFARAVSMAERFGLTTLAARTVSLSAGYHLDLFDLEGGEAKARQAAERGALLEFATPRVSAKLDLAAIHAQRHEVAPARALLDALAPAVEAGTGFHGWLWRGRMAMLRARLTALSGDGARALDEAAAAIEQCRRVRRVKHEMLARTLRAGILAELGRANDAATDLRAALDEVKTSADPAMRLRLCLGLLDLGPDERVRAEAEALACRIESALPKAVAERFRASSELRELG
jgi:tetratricopeptide (TPR) repeat protein